MMNLALTSKKMEDIAESLSHWSVSRSLDYSGGVIFPFC
jgi:hypothetical protein